MQGKTIIKGKTTPFEIFLNTLELGDKMEDLMKQDIENEEDFKTYIHSDNKEIVKDIRNIIGGKAVLKKVLAKLEPDSGSD